MSEQLKWRGIRSRWKWGMYSRSQIPKRPQTIQRSKEVNPITFWSERTKRIGNVRYFPQELSRILWTSQGAVVSRGPWLGVIPSVAEPSRVDHWPLVISGAWLKQTWGFEKIHRPGVLSCCGNYPVLPCQSIILRKKLSRHSEWVCDWGEAGESHLQVLSRIRDKIKAWDHSTGNEIAYLFCFKILCVCVSHSVRLFCDPMDCVACQVPLSMEFSRQEYWTGNKKKKEYWTGWLFPSPGDLPDSGTN